MHACWLQLDKNENGVWIREVEVLIPSSTASDKSFLIDSVNLISKQSLNAGI